MGSSPEEQMWETAEKRQDIEQPVQIQLPNNRKSGKKEQRN